MDIVGKVAIVTGAASGIGRATARGLSIAGAAAVVVDIDRSGGEETVRMIQANGGEATFVEADVSMPSGIRNMFAWAERIYGGVDILHNNAGIVAGGASAWPHTSLEYITQIVAVNLAGVMMGTRAAIDALWKRGGGAVINTGSVAALFPFPYDPVYAGSKSGIITFTQSCKPLKESHNIRVNGILLGFVDTAQLAKAGDGVDPPEWVATILSTSTATMMQPEEVATAVIDLVRDDVVAGEMRMVGAE